MRLVNAMNTAADNAMKDNSVYQLIADYEAVRRYTVELAAPLSEEDCCVQSMPDASPVKWHMAHTTWFFETFILERFEPEFRPFHPMFRVLFNSYYNGVGEKHPRPQRGMLTRPSLDEVRAYRDNVDERIGRLLSRPMRGSMRNALPQLVTLGVQHEQQHQELILTDVKHLLSLNPLAPAYAEGSLDRSERPISAEWFHFDAALVEIGFGGAGFCFDNETPRHREFVEEFSMASRLVTNGEFLAFIDAGAYRNPALWLSEGWDWVQANKLSCPTYWHADGSGWQEFTLHGMQTLDPQRPAAHISYFEAEAYARWAEARLPTEAEWEWAANRLVRAEEAGALYSSSLHPNAASHAGLTQLFGAVWQWTSSSYAPYPGYVVAEGAIGEYNGKFMVNQYVLRGASCVTPLQHARISYRNFFPASARWQFTGIRLAKS